MRSVMLHNEDIQVPTHLSSHPPVSCPIPSFPSPASVSPGRAPGLRLRPVQCSHALEQTLAGHQQIPVMKTRVCSITIVHFLITHFDNA